MSPATAVAAVLFDLDGTLAVPNQDPEMVLSTAFERAGVEPFCDADELQVAADDVPDADSDRDFFRRAFRIAAQRHDGPLDEAARLARAYDETVDRSAVSFRPGAQSALEFARSIGPVGLITNGGRENQLVKLRALGIEDAFDARVFAGDDTPPKPATEPFQAAVESLGVDPGSAYYVGNSLPHDVVGARQAGLGVGWIPHRQDVEVGQSDVDVRPDHTLETLADLEDALEPQVASSD